MSRVKLIYVLFLSQIFCFFSHGQPQTNFFRDDYKYLEETRSFYKIHTLQKSWDNAKRKCSMEGASLFYPEDENDVVLRYLKESQPGYAWIFVGISSQLAKGVFQTVDGVPIRHVYNKWGPGEPNDSNGEEDCVIMRQDGMLSDEKCSKVSSFICKKTLSSLKWNEECNTPYSDYTYNENLGRCYKFHLNPLNWREAMEACDSEQSYLAIINTQEEANYLVNITETAPKDNLKGTYLRGAVHLGFSYNNIENGWRTSKGETLEDAGYAAWGNQQPDGGEKERCGSMFYNGHLNDISCDAQNFFICEKENRLLAEFNDKFGGHPYVKRFRNDYKYFEDTWSFYKIHTMGRTWDEAKRRCDLEGASLFYPKDQKEADVVRDYWKETQNFEWIYIGISARLGTSVFKTIDGISMTLVYNKWGQGEPNNANGDENCVAMNRNGLLNDDSCSKKYSFICKKSLQSVKWNKECNGPFIDYQYNKELGECYKLHLHPLNWRQAAEACDAEQANLAIINSQQEADYLVNIIEKSPKDEIRKQYLHGSVHLGFTYDTAEETWKTVTGQALDDTGYAVWGNNQTDGGENESCGSMFYNGYLNKVNCIEHKCFFICESDKSFW